MSDDDSFFDRMFNRPSGIPGRIGVMLMTRMNNSVAADVLDDLAIEQTDTVLEIGFGPGIGIEHAAALVSDGYVAGVDISEMMVERARRRNETTIETGHVDLRIGSAEDLPFDGETFDAAFSINSVHAWPDQPAGVSEIYRVLKPGGRVALVLTKHAGQPDEPIEDLLETAGFERIRQLSHFDGESVLGRKPDSA